MRSDMQPLGSRRFLVVSHRTPTDGDFSLNDLPGSGGRVDVLARCVSSALLVSNAIRKDASIAIYFGSGTVGGRSVIISGGSVKYLNPDERSTAALLRNALVKARGGGEGEASPGISYSERTLPELLSIMASGCNVHLLEEDGRMAVGLEQPSLFVLGDSLDLSREEADQVEAFSPRHTSISTISQQSDQCIVIVNWLLDNGH